MPLFRLALAQLLCDKGAVRQNLAATRRCYSDAVSRGVDILALPEMSLTGYIDPARWPAAVLRLDGPEVAELAAMTRGAATTLVAGIVESNPAGKPFITQVVAQAGQIVGYYRKWTVEEEELDWFSPGDTPVPLFWHRDLPFSLAICADIGNRAVFAEGARRGARLVLEVAAPGLYGEQSTRDWESGFRWWQGKCVEQLGAYARDFGLWIAVATQAGRTVDEDFPGGGYLFAPGGKLVYATPDWSTGVEYLEIDVNIENNGYHYCEY